MAKIVGVHTLVGPQVQTSVATTSGTFVDFLIPSGVKRITLMLNGVSTNGTTQRIVQIGDGTINTSGYQASVSDLVNTGPVVSGSSTNSFALNAGAGSTASASVFMTGSVTLVLTGSNTWVISGTVAYNGVGVNSIVAGTKVLTGILDRVRLTTTNGTDVFDAGSVNISYEY